MNLPAPGTKILVTMRLNADVVRDAGALTSDLSKTVEELLASYIVEQRLKRGEDDRALDATIAWLDEIHATYGLPGADFSPL